MSTGSISHDVVIADPEAAKRFLEALEAAEQAASLPRHPAFEVAEGDVPRGRKEKHRKTKTYAETGFKCVKLQ